MELTVVNNTVAPRDNTVELSTLTYQIVGRQPFAAETNHVPSRHRDADLPLNSTVLTPRKVSSKLFNLINFTERMVFFGFEFFNISASPPAL